jgi:hypothetical protein
MLNGTDIVIGGALLDHQASMTRQTIRDAAASNAERDALARQVSVLKAEVARLNLALAAKTAHADAIKAQLKAFQDLAPAHPLMAASGMRFASGNIKTKGRLIYEAEFDRIAASKGIRDPKTLRAD